MVFSGKSGWSTCGKIEKSTTPSVMSSPVIDGFDSTNSSPTLGVITMLPALSPTQPVLSMLGSAVSSSTPKDFQPNSHIGHLGSLPLMKFHARSGPLNGCPYPAVGIHRALQSAIGLPRRSSSALWMLRFLMPADVSRYFMMILSQLSKTSSVRRTDGGKGIRQGGE